MISFWNKSRPQTAAQKRKDETSMKKIVALLLVLVLCMGMTSAMADKLGSYMHTEVSKANAAGEKDGSYQANTTICAVVLDDNGVIKNVKFDVVQVKLGFTAAGACTVEAGTVIASKEELKDGYGMRKASAIGKEWFEQAAALEAWCVGKTVEEVLAAPLNNGYPTDADLVTGCTMGISDYLFALQKAAELAK